MFVCTTLLNNQNLKTILLYNEPSFTSKCHHSVKRDFFKLMNNSNFGFYCRNNANNCFFQPIYDEIEELSYARKY